MGKIIELKEITKRYHLKEEVVVALDALSVEIYDNEFIVIMGPSGSGKSTLVNILAGMDHQVKGSLLYKGIDIYHGSKKILWLYRQKVVGLVFQTLNLIPGTTVGYNIKLPRYISSIKESSINFDKDLLLNDLGIKLKKSSIVDNLSLGEQQRVAIARALMNDPDILIADEPTGNLDSANGTRLMEILIHLHKESKKTIVIATHNPEIALAADRVIYLKDGRIDRIEVHTDKSSQELAAGGMHTIQTGRFDMLKKIALAFFNLRKDFMKYSLMTFAFGVFISILVSISLFSYVVINNLLLAFAPHSFSQTYELTQPLLQKLPDIPITQHTIDTLNRLPGVGSAYPITHFYGDMVYNHTSKTLYAATGSSVTKARQSEETISSGRYFLKDDEHSIILTPSSLHVLGITNGGDIIGKKIELDVSLNPDTAKTQQIQVYVTVVGILKNDLMLFPNLLPSNFFSIAGFKGTEPFDSAYIYVQDPSYIGNVGSKIQNMRYQSILLSDMTKGSSDGAAITQSWLFIIGFVVLTTVVFSMINFLTVIFNERIREVGILKAIGASAKDIIFLYAWEGAFIGIGIGFIAVLLCIQEISILNSFLQTQFLQNATVTSTIGITYGGSEKAITFIVSILVGILTIAYPAIWGARINIMKALGRGIS